jgi:ribosomal protein S12 methylthiotransferase
MKREKPGSEAAATAAAERPLRVGLISLGCAKNLVDAEIMLGSLIQGGVEITNDAGSADAVIVNTCSFIDAAQEESVDTILESNEVREANRRGQALIVSGCLPQRFRDDLPKLLPEVDAFMGIDQVTQVTTIVKDALARRASRLEAEPGAGTGGASRRGKGGGARRGQIVPRLAELDAKGEGTTEAGKGAAPGAGSVGHGPDESLRGTARFGRTRTVVAPAAEPAAAPAGPGMEVNVRPVYIPDYATPRFRLTPRHFAYVKIAEGCNHPCSFCIIPRMRGTHRSRGQSDVVAEARQLLADGVRELNLISQDTTYYGLDLRTGHSRNIASPEKFTAATKTLAADATTLCTLIRELNGLKGDFWIRLLYTHPAHWTDELIRTMAECKKVARYVDMPLQHIHPVMLERMRRETSREYIEELIARIRAGIPGIALRTTFIVGFPGETEACFESLVEFIETTKFERLGVFTYSKEDGTRAAGMAGHVPPAVRKKRRDRAMAAQRRVAAEVSQAFVGRTLRVLVEQEATARELQNASVSSWEHGLIRGRDTHQSALSGRYLVARGEADAPDIDGRVYVRGKLPLGQFSDVRIIGHTDYDLIAEPS